PKFREGQYSTSEALGCAHRALGVAGGAIGGIDLVAQHGGSVIRVAEGGQDAAQPIGHEKAGASRRPRQFAEEATSQAVVRGVALVGAIATVEVLFQPKGSSRLIT